MRHVNLRPGETPRTSALQALVRAAYQNIADRLQAADRCNPET